MAAVETISDVVMDSPNKIFIGGISKALSSKMLTEIVSVFGPLKAYHFEVNEELNESCAFVEYVDQSVTLKACAGLTGIKLGGRVLTLVQAIRSASSVENSGNASLYEIPEYAKPFLKQPSQVLKLRNVFNLEQIASLSGPEMDEVLDDVRLECARFGSVKSIKMVKHDRVTVGACRAVNDIESGGYGQNLGSKDKGAKTDTLEEHIYNEFRDTSGVEFPSDVKEVKEDEATEGNCPNDDKLADDFILDKSCQIDELDKSIKIQGSEKLSNRAEELPNQPSSIKDASECYDDKVTEFSVVNKSMAEEGSTLEEVDDKKQEAFSGKDGSVGTESNAIEKSETKEQDNGKVYDYDLRSIFEPGSVFVEFGRTEAALMAAHCLHGRVFEDRIVTVEYVALDHYRAQFPN